MQSIPILYLKFRTEECTRIGDGSLAGNSLPAFYPLVSLKSLSWPCPFDWSTM